MKKHFLEELFDAFGKAWAGEIILTGDKDKGNIAFSHNSMWETEWQHPGKSYPGFWVLLKH